MPLRVTLTFRWRLRPRPLSLRSQTPTADCVSVTQSCGVQDASASTAATPATTVSRSRAPSAREERYGPSHGEATPTTTLRLGRPRPRCVRALRLHAHRCCGRGVAMTYRCTATVEPGSEVMDRAACLDSPTPDIDWAEEGALQCMLEDGPHDRHVTFLRSGGHRNSDVFLCWRDEAPAQWLADLECCLLTATRLGSGCTLYKGHPGACEWAIVDLAREARLRAQAYEMARRRSTPEFLRSALNALL